MQVCAPTDAAGARGVSVVLTQELTGDEAYDIFLEAFWRVTTSMKHIRNWAVTSLLWRWQ